VSWGGVAAKKNLKEKEKQGQDGDGASATGTLAL
jgi:hypothetical protein